MGKINNYQLDINDRAFLAIKNGTKKVEIRVTTDKLKKDYGKYQVGEYVTFINSNSERLKCIIKEINWYKNERELLTLEGTKLTLSSTNDIEEGIKSINSYKNYTEGIKKNGIYAIHIEPVINNIFDMKLQKEYYDYIKNGTKRIEIRLNDEKRSKIKINNIIRFHLIDNENEFIKVKVIGLLKYNNIINLINDHAMELLTRKDMTKEELINIFNNIYSVDKQEMYGVIGIRFELEK